MKNYIITMALTICAILQINSKQMQSAKGPSAPIKQTATTDKFAKWKKLWTQTKQALKPMSRDEQVQHQVNYLLKWANSEPRPDDSDIMTALNPSPRDNAITLEAKEIAKEQLFPKSYWERYAPQFMQNAVQFIKRRLYPPTSTMTITKQILGKTQTIIIKNPKNMTPEELRKAFEINIPTQ